MNKNLRDLERTEYDLVVIGGGIFGICAAWDGALRGLSVALIEKGDFSQATSANHLKMIHGGIRYLQHLDIHRIRESCHERSILFRIAPHLSYPLPIAFPTYGHGIKGKEFLGAGFALYDLLTWDRNRGLEDPGKRTPTAEFLSSKDLLRLFPVLKERGLTGGAVFHDGQMYNPPRLALSFLRAAIEQGADAGNYLEVTGFLRNGTRIHGVQVTHVLTGERFDVRGRQVLNAAGPWAAGLLESTIGIRIEPRPVFSRDLGFVIPRAFPHEYGLACQIESRDDDALLSRGGRHIFLVPWREHTLVGCWHQVYEDSPDRIAVTEDELQKYVWDINRSWPAFPLTVDDITMVNTGLTLFAGDSRSGNHRFGKRSLLINHSGTHGIEGLVTLIGVRATTARGMAEKAVDLVFRKGGRTPPDSRSAVTPVYGGRIERFDRFLADAVQDDRFELGSGVMQALAHNYGSRYRDVLKYIDRNPELSGRIGDSAVLKAEVVHAVREEMAERLEDVVMRRTDLGTAGHPGEEAISICARIMAAELGWDRARIEREVENVNLRLLNRSCLKSYGSPGVQMTGDQESVSRGFAP